ncbi:MAG TPA: 50S ribosomal protein L37Ae [Thermoplasmatales archaeon]|nr:MAG: 50S ribosomal protein L37ae [Thermoplasmata archaeon]HDD57151.1 50S ribosomal protein L37Ae [Thermoplasmatales archaeon]HEB37760.1 50S ribosomal protein L37Ae [Thermoplasmatales archaeon]
MAKRTKKIGSAGRFRARYGVLARNLVRDIEKVQRSKHVCPSCGYKKVKRVSAGIWRCRKCGTTFAGGAYSPRTDMGMNVERTLRLHEGRV